MRSSRSSGATTEHPATARSSAALLRTTRRGLRMSAGWPTVLSHGPLRLRPLAVGDRRAWRRVRQRNMTWLSRWDATTPPGADARPRTFGAMVRAMQREARSGRQLPFAVEYDG